MHPPAVRSEILALVVAGLSDSEIARRTGVPRTTVRDVRAPRYVARERGLCPRCWRRAKVASITADDYAELLGLYLGDGYIEPLPRTWDLRIFMDARYEP